MELDLEIHSPEPARVSRSSAKPKPKANGKAGSQALKRGRNPCQGTGSKRKHDGVGAAAEKYVQNLLATSGAVKDVVREPSMKRARNANVLLGSDCSGYGSDFLALHLLGVPVRTAFCAECDPVKVRLLRDLHKLHNDAAGDDFVLYHDIKARDNSKAPKVDIFVSGAPCPAWSSDGKRLGLADLQDRGVTLFYSLDYVRHQTPKVVVLENVQGIRSERHVCDAITTILENLKYRVHQQVINTKDHGIPQNRPRWYLIAIQRDSVTSKFRFPKPLPCSWKLEMFLDMTNLGNNAKPFPKWVPAPNATNACVLLSCEQKAFPGTPHDA